MFSRNRAIRRGLSFYFQAFSWAGRERAVASSVYVYKLEATSTQGLKLRSNKKMTFLR